MDGLFTLENLSALGVLIFLQAVLGFDNLLYISIESKRAPAADQKRVRQWGILIAVALRIVLLFVMIALIDSFKTPFVSFNWPGMIEGEFNFGNAVFIIGGVFIMYTAVKEITHMLVIDNLAHGTEREPKSAWSVIAMIVLMNLIFSFDSILSALAISDVFMVLAAAIITSGILMLVLADHVAAFLSKNRMFEVLGLFILLIVGVMLLGEGGHQAHLKFFGYPVEAMSKTTFYFSIVVLVLVDIVQTRYQRKLEAQRMEESAARATPAE